MGDNLSLSLSIDTQKVLPDTDPLNRQIMIGIGCFCELLRMAAAEDGYHLVFDWFPNGVVNEQGLLDNRAIADISFSQGGKSDPLFAQVLERRSYKKVFTDKKINNNQLGSLIKSQTKGISLHASNSYKFVKHMRSLTVKAMEIELTTERTYLESMNLLRIGTDEVKSNPDGISLDGYTFMFLRMFGLFTHEDSRNMNSPKTLRARKELLEIIDSSHGYAWIVTPNNTRIDQITAGRNYLRTNLKVTELGLKMHPVSQSLQEFSEMREVRQQVNQLLEIAEPNRLQMLARLGYGGETDPSPRWPLDKIIKSNVV
jgi:hypothetical protein